MSATSALLIVVAMAAAAVAELPSFDIYIGAEGAECSGSGTVNIEIESQRMYVIKDCGSVGSFSMRAIVEAINAQDPDVNRFESVQKPGDRTSTMWQFKLAGQSMKWYECVLPTECGPNETVFSASTGITLTLVSHPPAGN